MGAWILVTRCLLLTRAHTHTRTKPTPPRLQAQGTTVLEIAHRLHSVVGSNKVLVLDAGRVAEFAAPSVLAARPPRIIEPFASEDGKGEEEGEREQGGGGGEERETWGHGTFRALLDSTGTRTAEALVAMIKH